MSGGHAGIPTQKTRQRLAYVKKYANELYGLANTEEKKVFDTLAELTEDLTEIQIGERAGVSKSIVNTMLVRFYNYYATPEVTSMDLVDDNNKYGFKVEWFMGNKLVLLSHVEAYIDALRSQPVEVVSVDSSIHMAIETVAYEKRSGKDAIISTIYPRNPNNTALADLFSKLKAGGTIGITPIN